ncbi:MAG: CCA tRNA nucleotidyltransferase [Bacilli bacterium]
MDKKIVDVLNKIEQKGFEAYIVGGYVRDYILGIKSTDIDITTNALPKDLATIFDNYDSINSKYGAFKFFSDNYNIDITTYRKEYDYVGRKPNRIEYVDNLLDDLERRDFTINTLCMNSKGEIVDLLNARSDIENKIIKGIGDINKKFVEDPLRILRALRFAIILDFEIDDEVLAGIVTHKELIKTLSWTRKKYELDCILSSKNVIKGLELLKSIGVLNLLGISYDKINYVADKCGMYSQLEITGDYQFNNSEKENIKNIREILKYGKVDNYILYDYGLYNAIVAGSILGVNVKIINKMYNDLPIKTFEDIDITSEEICEILNIRPCIAIKKIFYDIKDKILDGNLKNNKENIKKYIIINKRKWLNEGNVT